MKFVKKLTALFLAIIMTMALGITAFAADTTLTIKTTDGHTYKVYQILTGDVSNLTDGEGTLSNVKVGSSVTKAGATADGIVAALKDLEDGALGDAAYDYVQGGTAVQTVTGDGTNKTVTVAEGYYVVTDETTKGDAVSRYLVGVVGPTTMEPKTETTDIDKNIIDNKKADGTTDDPNKALDYVEGKGGKTDTAAIGDEIQYEVTGEVPNYEGYKYYYYVLNDTLSKGLTLDEDSFVVTVGGGQPLTKGTDYYVTVTKNDDGTTSFVLAFNDIMNYDKEAAISIKYNATVNEYAVIGTEPNTNTASLTYSNNPNSSSRGDKEGQPGVPGSSTPTGETPTYQTKTYVTELNLTKVDQDGMPLKGAEFELTGTNLNKVIIRTDYTFAVATNGDYYALNDGTYTTTAPTKNEYNGDGTLKTQSNYTLYKDATSSDNGDNVTVSQKYARTTVVSTTTTSATSNKVTASVNDNGFVTFTGLNAGTYTLHESKTPTGYNTVADIEFTISASETGHVQDEQVGGGISWSSNNSNVTLNNGTFYVTVKNVKGTILPSTGGMGTTVIYVAGIAMIVAAGVVVIARKRFA